MYIYFEKASYIYFQKYIHIWFESNLVNFEIPEDLTIDLGNSLPTYLKKCFVICPS